MALTYKEILESIEARMDRLERYAPTDAGAIRQKRMAGKSLAEAGKAMARAERHAARMVEHQVRRTYGRRYD
jgi:hypothetical protein